MLLTQSNSCYIIDRRDNANQFPMQINLIAILLIDRFQLPLATLAAGYFLEGFTGSFSTVMSCLFAYVTDTVPVASRTIIFTLIEGAFFLGFTVGPLLMAFIISQTKSNITIFYVALIGNILTVSFLWFWVKESRDYDPTKDDKRGWSIWKLAKEYCNIFNSLKVLIEPFSRARLILIGIFLVIQICFRGFMLVFIVYTNARFGWTSKEDGYYFFIQCLAKIVAIGLLTPLVSWISGVPLRSPSKTEEVVDMEVEQASASSSSSSSHEGKCCAHIPHEDEDNEVPTEFTQLLNSDIADVEKSIVAQDREQKPGVWLDGILIKSGLLIYCFAFFAFGLANEGWMFYAITIFDSAAILLFPSLRATITKTVEQSKQGTLLSSLGILESIAGILSPIIFNTIYTATVSTHPNIIFFVIGVAYFLAFLVSLVVRRREIGVKEENNAEEFTDEDS
ncbi:hypothetical protein BKA69DRAFT_1051438 [Paraphysoderma sedebokerense]|nr:hypothetical protein BKA69DRAFT_1051438 [Paraphysoderma sedebokerense]